MAFDEIVAGQEKAWTLLDKIGEGDAGEVYWVESLLEKRRAILKRAHRSAYTTDILRQASQIDREGRVLRLLASLNTSQEINITVPRFLDKSKAAVHESGNYFIVITPAPGFNLSELAQSVRLGGYPPNNSTIMSSRTDRSPEEQAFLARLARSGKFPELILLRALSGLISFLEKIHSFKTNSTTERHFGVIWNDVKPEHFYWNPINTTFMLIDWGNAQFLGPDGVTEDRKYSRLDDYKQLLEQMGDFVETMAPTLFNKLEWSLNLQSTNIYSVGILPLKKRIDDLIDIDIKSHRIARQEESRLAQLERRSFEHFLKLDQVHDRIVGLGELPEHDSARVVIQNASLQIIQEGNLDAFHQALQLGHGAAGA